MFFWEDSTRKEWYTSDLNGIRKLMVQVWYPTSYNNRNKMGHKYR